MKIFFFETKKSIKKKRDLTIASNLQRAPLGPEDPRESK